MKYIIGTRGSRLAMAQAGQVCDRLKEAFPENDYEIRVIRTRGDVVQDRPLDQIGGRGVFVKEIEELILAGRVDIGVHSMKDMPAEPAPGLMFTKAWRREDPRDVLILREKKGLEELPSGAVIGTGSRRRELQLLRLRPDLKVVGIRGNVDSRLRKMEEQKLDGIVLAAAGLHRLGLADRITEYLEPEQMIPAPAQGTLALEIREDNEAVRRMLDALSEEEAENCTEAERDFLREMDGDCHIPVGALCSRTEDGAYLLRVVFGKRNGPALAFAGAKGGEPEKLAAEAAEAIRKQLAGKVYLVGAGPGDPGLITVKGLEILRQADCIIYDRLSSPELLEEAKGGCERIYVGKENHNHTMKQEEINRLLIRKSLEYERVVRLKGGDAYVFGRGGEEGMALAERGIPFEVIPGVSSCTAGLACAGIPVTHRGVASGFHVVTAHDRRDALAEIDFEAMARGKETCVFLMGLEKVNEITDRLLEAGMPPETAAAVISRATTPQQRTVVSTLARLAEETRRAGLESPALIVAGNVVKLREYLNFHEKKPLFGKKYLLPGIGKRAAGLAELLRRQGAGVDVIPVGEITFRRISPDAALLQRTDWLIFTSQNGVEGFLKGLADSGMDLRILAGCSIAAVGGKCADALKSHGLYADLIPEKWNSDALAEALKEELTGRRQAEQAGRQESGESRRQDGGRNTMRETGQEGLQRVLYLRAENGDDSLRKRMAEFCIWEELSVYENRPVVFSKPWKAGAADYDGILCTCASSAGRLLELCGGFGEGTGTGRAGGNTGTSEWAEGGIFYSIGPKTTACLKKHGVRRILEAEEASFEGLVRLCMEESRKDHG